MEFTTEQEAGQQLMQTLTKKAWESTAFKEQLISNPKKAIQNITEKEIKLPENTTIVVEDQTDTSNIYLNIPRKVNVESLELTDEQLEMVSGGEFVTLLVGVAIVGLFAAGVGIGLTISAMNKD